MKTSQKNSKTRVSTCFFFSILSLSLSPVRADNQIPAPLQTQAQDSNPVKSKIISKKTVVSSLPTPDSESLLEEKGPVEILAPELQVQTWSLKVRNKEGEQVCSLIKGENVTPMAITKDQSILQIKLNPKFCKGYSRGEIDVNYVSSVIKTESESKAVFKVAGNGLSLRSQALVDSKSYLCHLPAESELEVLKGEDNSYHDSMVSMSKVKLRKPVEGCADEGWIVLGYTKPLQKFKDLPIYVNDLPEVKPNPATPCSDCASTAGQSSQIELQKEIASGVNSLIAQNADATENNQRHPYLNFLDFLAKNKTCPRSSPYPCQRGLVAVPQIGENNGVCGSFRYTLPFDQRNGGTTRKTGYAAPITSCAFTAFAQEWKKSFCPNNDDGCRLSWGHISHYQKRLFAGHRSHTDGYCIDLRPARKGSFRPMGLRYQSSDEYDRDKTIEMINLIKKMGGSQIFFNDRRLQKEVNAEPPIVSSIPNHDDHVHFCFKDNPTTRDVCQNLKIDGELCPEMQ